MDMSQWEELTAEARADLTAGVLETEEVMRLLQARPDGDPDTIARLRDVTTRFRTGLGMPPATP